MAGDLPSAVLFACTQNVIRSVMAAAIMKHYYGHETEDMTRFFLSMADSVVAAPAGAPKDPMDDLYEAFKDD